MIFIGWDGADRKLLDPLMKEGRLPISGRSRRVPAIWNLASAKGLTVGVVGWWATWPAEKVKGFFVSDRAAPVLFDPEALSKSPALTWPEGLADGVRLIGRREGSPPFEDVAQALHIPRAEFDAAVAGKMDLENPVTGYRKILGVTRVNGKVALELYDRGAPELSFMRKVVAAYPREDRYRASLGKAFFENEDCASARPIFADLAGRTPVDSENLNLLALTSWCLGDAARAEDAFRESLAVNPNQPVVREGLSLLRKGQPLQ